MGGLRPISAFAIEADYIDLGFTDVGGDGVNFDSAHFEYAAVAGYAVGYLPMPVPYLDVFGKVGVARYMQRSDESFPGGFSAPLSNDGTGFAWGVGGQARRQVRRAARVRENQHPRHRGR